MLFSIEFKSAMGLAAVGIMLAAFGIQLWKTYEGKSEPHPISWFGWGLLTAVGYLVQWQKGAGAGSWVMGLTAISCFLVGTMSLCTKRWRPADFDGWDRAALLSGVSFFLLYLIFRNAVWGPLISAVLATLADVILYVPIFKRGRLSPRSENATAYALNSLKFLPSIFGLESYSAATLVYPSAMIGINAIVVVYLLKQRNKMQLCRTITGAAHSGP